MEPEKKVIAKFQVSERTELVDGYKVRMMPVVTGSPENAEFYKWTPSGAIELYTINKNAAEMFKPGKALYVEFREAK